MATKKSAVKSTKTTASVTYKWGSKQLSIQQLTKLYKASTPGVKAAISRAYPGVCNSNKTAAKTTSKVATKAVAPKKATATFKVGQRLNVQSGKKSYNMIITKVYGNIKKDNTITLVDTTTGKTWNNRIQVKNLNAITSAELASLVGRNTKVTKAAKKSA